MFDNHAPIVSALKKGPLRYRKLTGEEVTMSVSEGFVEMNNNVASVCVEGIEK